jgi:hypothetical protein
VVVVVVVVMMMVVGESFETEAAPRAHIVVRSLDELDREAVEKNL